MLKLIPRQEQYLLGYKAYCQEFYDHHIDTFMPMKPDDVTLEWFRNSFSWYQKREKGLIEGQPKSICLWAVDGHKFIGEFQLRTELTDEIMTTIGSIGYSVRVTEQGKGYGDQILMQGLTYAKSIGIEKVILLINESNIKSRKLCEKHGGKYLDTIIDGEKICRYWVYL